MEFVNLENLSKFCGQYLKTSSKSETADAGTKWNGKFWATFVEEKNHCFGAQNYISAKVSTACGLYTECTNVHFPNPIQT
jgi:hypothetical protein